MKKTRYIIGLFLCVVLIQIAVPISKIVRWEMTLQNGQQFRFRTAPVDPYDAFRGRYVALQIEQNIAPVTEGVKLIRNQMVYAQIEESEQGFAKFVKVTLHRPQGSAYLKAKVQYLTGDKVVLCLPFDRYYMEEKIAPAAETAYRKHSRKDVQDAYVTVRVKSGFAVLEKLYVGEKTIEEYIKDQRDI
ncbi:MAG: GDYXXLXY domain-containing protein [Candidatus Desantisbacteria bacterium]